MNHDQKEGCYVIFMIAVFVILNLGALIMVLTGAEKGSTIFKIALFCDVGVGILYYLSEK